jgi:elongation factor G
MAGVRFRPTMAQSKTTPSFRPGDIRNLVLLGRGSAGKTSLAEAILHRSGTVSRLGSVDEQNTTSDFEPEARDHKLSTNSTLLYATSSGRELNLIDTPGHPEFIGHALAALAAVETAVIVVDAGVGVDSATARLFHAAGEAGLARMVAINKIDQHPLALPGVLAALRATLGPRLHPINLPCQGASDVIDCFDRDAGASDFGSVAEVHREMIESTVEIDDAEMEKYLAGEAIDLAELRATFVKAMNAGHVVPVLFTSAKTEAGIDDLLHVLVDESPSPITGRPRRLRRGDAVVEVTCDENAPLLAHVFKVTTDPYVGKLAMLRILQGKLDGQTAFVCSADKKARKAGHVLKVEGRDHPELESTAYAGDLVALAKIDDLHVGQILHAPGLADDVAAIAPALPVPVLSLAIAPVTKTDDVKVGTALAKLCEEDPTLRAGQDPATREFVLSGLGDLHLRVTLEKLKNRFSVDVTAKPPRIAYRETITTRAEGHFRLKKQTGGAGQFAEVFLRIEPLGRGEGFQFASEVFGGAIPTQFIPAVEKGVLDGLDRGVLAGYALRDVRVVVTDGKSHAVDSKDIAFRTAAKQALRDAVRRARPVLLEPIVAMAITVPEQHLGTVTADMKNLRARIMGVETQTGGTTLIRVHAPLAELRSYAGQLRGATAGEGHYTLELSHYDIVPREVEHKLVAAYVPRDDE